ncbi:hypothetical protein Ancab_003163 [Ancistrocladus abbreviatus]
MEGRESRTPGTSSLRWQILRQALLSRKCVAADEQSQEKIDCISRKAKNGFNLIPFKIVNHASEEDANSSSSLDCSGASKDVCFCYRLPLPSARKLFLFQRRESANINDFEICNEHDIDNTGLVCQWPSEDVLAYYCLLHADIFRSKRVIELGSGYGLAGLVIATVTEASEVVISDGNPQVVDYIKQNIAANTGAFGGTRVKSMTLHWNQGEISTFSNTFDIIIGSDCPRRGDSLDKFLEEIKENGLRFSLSENYDADVWKRHSEFMNGDQSWPNYEKDHCYPLLLRIVR